MKNVILIIGISLCLLSCKKIDSSSQVSNEQSEYLPMKIGNYWIYQEFLIKPNGDEIPTTKFDSVCITKDTMINGYLYYKFCSIVNHSLTNFGPNGYFRDSLGDLLFKQDIKLFSDNNFIDILHQESFIDATSNDTIYTILVKMEKLDNLITVPVGSFNVLNAKQIVNANPEYTSIVGDRFNKRYYAKNVGLILFSNFYLLDSNIIENRLIRYSIN